MQKLINVIEALKAPKAQYNSFGKYSYRSCEDILEAVKPLLCKEGLLLTIKDELVFIGDRYYIKAIATVTDGKAEIEATAYAREDDSKKGMDGSQLTGSTSSYARKYALNGLFLIDDNKDADATNKHGATQVNISKNNLPKQDMITDELHARLNELYEANSGKWNAQQNKWVKSLLDGPTTQAAAEAALKKIEGSLS